MKFIKNSIWLPFFIVISVFLIYAVVIIINVWPIDSKTIGQAGVFGDSFGVLTSIFSGLAFAGLIVTIWQQKADLELTRREILDQLFENVLFKMIEIHNTIVSDIDLRKKYSSENNNQNNDNSLIATGRDCFPLFYQRLSKTYEQNFKKNKHDLSFLLEIYTAFWNEHQKDLGHYFRYLYNIFKFINESEVENKRLYTNIVRAQLSDYELLLLFYNGLSVNGEKKFKPLIEKFHLFDNLPKDILIIQSHLDHYQDSAYN